MNIKCILYDFDGVMTNNLVLLSEDGKESVSVNRSDGLAVSYFKKKNIKQFIISTEKNPVVTARANKLKIKVFQGISNKLKVVKEIMKNLKLQKENIAFVGNDLNDMEVIDFLTYTFCPKDSHPDVLAKANKIINCNGGDGVIMILYNILGEQIE